jgi:Type II secretion system (T2SS), protein E, N-terminal domain
LRSLVAALPKFFVLAARRCAHKDCQKHAVRLAVSPRAVGISMQEQWFCGADCFETALVSAFEGLLLPSRRRLPAPRNRVPLGLMLLSRGHLSQDQLRTALDRHHATGARLGDVVLNLGFATEDQVTSALAAQCGYPVFPLRSAASDLPVRIPLRLLELNSMLPVHYAEATRRLLLGFANTIDYRTLDAIAKVLPCAPSPCIIAGSEYRRRLESILAQTRDQEVFFEGESSPREMAHTVRSYAVQLHAEEMRFATCRDHLWARLRGRRHEMDILFRLGTE